MKITICITLIILCPFIVLSKGFVLKGTIEGLPSGTVSLDYINESGEDTTIKVQIANGLFILSGNIPEPELVRLTISEGWSYNTSFFLENADISIALVKDAPWKTVVTGSASNLVYEKLKPGQMKFFEQARQNEAAHQQAAGTGNSEALQSADSLWNVQQSQWIQDIRANISANKGDYAALYFVQWLLFRPGNYDAIKSAFMQLSPTVRNGIAGKKFLSDFEHLYKISSGQPTPEITGKDTSGLSVALSLLKGKVVLLDFWASYCGPCRQENKNLLAVYQKYHATGFEIVSFSLDSERSKWLGAIQADGLIWPQASELRGGASATANTYEISDLPRNVLIDKRGTIYAKDIHGAELIKAIEQLLAKQ